MKYHLRERWYGSFTRSVSLPANIQGDAIQANYQDGVLTLTLPKTEEEKPRWIQITSGGSSKALEGTAHEKNGKRK